MRSTTIAMVMVPFRPTHVPVAHVRQRHVSAHAGAALTEYQHATCKERDLPRTFELNALAPKTFHGE